MPYTVLFTPLKSASIRSIARSFVINEHLIRIILMEIIGWQGGWLLLGHGFVTSDM